jgi:glycosyltransferase involved in cell wall biosynthesis
MNILAIYPGLNLEMNEFAYVMQQLAEQGHHVTVITARQNPMKGIQNSPVFEQIGRLRIYRPYKNFDQMIYFPRLQGQVIQSIVDRAQPEIIFCSQEYNMQLAKMVQHYARVPIVLAVEDAGRIAAGVIPGKIRPKLMWLVGVPTYGRFYWRWLCHQSDAIITYDANDVDCLQKLSAIGTPVHYIPWCNPLPRDFVMPDQRENRLIYIGTFSQRKNTDALGWMIPQILQQTPTERALLIGPGDTGVVDTLQKQFGDRVQYLPGCSRKEALTYLAASFFALTPMQTGFGGLIGDAWSVATPLVTIPGNRALIHKQDALIPATPDEVAATVNCLFTNPALYQTLQAGGAQRAQKSSVAGVAGQMIHVISQVVQTNHLPNMASLSATT